MIIKLVENLKREKEIRNMKQEEFAALLGETQPFLSKLLNGNVTGITSYKIMKYADKLDVDYKKLII